MVLLKPREVVEKQNSFLRLILSLKNEFTLRTADILRVLEEQGDSIAVVLLSGVQYFTGQLFEIDKITQAAQAKVSSAFYTIFWFEQNLRDVRLDGI